MLLLSAIVFLRRVRILLTFDSFSGYLVLEDLTAGFTRPCLLDIKMGTRHYDDNASAKKIQYEVEKSNSISNLALAWI